METAARDMDQELDRFDNDHEATGQLMAELFAHATARESISRDELAQLSDDRPEEVDRAIERLLRLGVLRTKTGQPGRLVPVAPATAHAQLLMPAIRELRDRQAMINDASAQLAHLLPVYESSVMRRTGQQLVHHLEDVDAVRSALSELSARATREILTSQPGGSRPEAVLKEATDRTVHVLKRGVRMRTLYQYAAQFHQPTVDHATLFVAHGAEVRLVTDAFMRLIVFDREVALIELLDNAQGAVLVRDPNIIHFLVRAFERAWDRALAFPLAHDRDQVLRSSEEMKTAIVKLLVEGYDDKVVAKRLGISLRTFQRHLAEVLRRIGANNRIHAGYLLRDLGMFHEKYA
ncbi:LuxR C-terminal-related transcriptional regulator [Streptomyces sp. NPDC050485]|uniref:LuxR C-terminal-related transcriptional regulator n=1 Tax=Streptomyces sp. NPDC050485 TaxID=3365617 RepID=UPI00379BD694